MSVPVVMFNDCLITSLTVARPPCADSYRRYLWTNWLCTLHGYDRLSIRCIQALFCTGLVQSENTLQNNKKKNKSPPQKTEVSCPDLNLGWCIANLSSKIAAEQWTMSTTGRGLFFGRPVNCLWVARQEAREKYCRNSARMSSSFLLGFKGSWHSGKNDKSWIKTDQCQSASFFDDMKRSKQCFEINNKAAKYCTAFKHFIGKNPRAFIILHICNSTSEYSKYSVLFDRFITVVPTQHYALAPLL